MNKAGVLAEVEEDEGHKRSVEPQGNQKDRIRDDS
jgi:hypothetical protein